MQLFNHDFFLRLNHWKQKFVDTMSFDNHGAEYPWTKQMPLINWIANNECSGSFAPHILRNIYKK